jgi:hypothetical protein
MFIFEAKKFFKKILTFFFDFHIILAFSSFYCVVYGGGFDHRVREKDVPMILKLIFITNLNRFKRFKISFSIYY